MQTASKSLIDVLNEIYESNWADRDQFCSQLQNIEILWHDYGHKLADQVLIPMNTYQSQFPEMKVIVFNPFFWSFFFAFFPICSVDSFNSLAYLYGFIERL